jgi:hypothetical protein
MRRRPAAAALVAVAVAAVAGACASTPTIPSDAQLIHVTAAPGVMSIEPTTAHRGDVYVVLEPPTTSVVFVQGSDGGSLRPMTQADIDRLATGDQQDTASETFEVGCDAAARARDQGRVKAPGNCGNVFRAEGLQPGLYAFLREDPAALPAGESVRMVVL